MRTRMEGKQLGGNVSELTAIAPIRTDGYVPLEKVMPEMVQATKAQKSGKPLEITWLDHLKGVLDLAHRYRQSDIRSMATIHYARWVILNDNRLLPGLKGPHLLFASNFDGKLDEYLMDFAEVDEGPLNLIFQHCVDWPGARPIEDFIRYVEEHQLSANLFFANYPCATVQEVNRSLYWKNETNEYIRKLENTSGKKWGAETRRYLEKLALPTPKEGVVKP